MYKNVFIRSIIFNLVETLLIFGCGLILKIKATHILLIMLLFMFSKALFGKSLHYKKWYKCLLCSLLILSTLFGIFKFDSHQAFILTVFSSYIMTSRADVNVDYNKLTENIVDFINKNLYHWSGKSSKYDPLRDFVGLSPNNSIILDYEEYWRKNNPLRLEIFRLFYRERKTYEEIRKLKDYDENNIIKGECKSIYEQLEIPLNLPPLKKS